MSPGLVAQLEAEAARAADPASVRAADAHALACYRQQLIDAPTLRRLHAVLTAAPGAEDRRTR